MGLQTCVTLGMLKDGQADELKDAGLDYYNHNLDTDASFYGQVITTHKHADRIDTLGRCAKQESRSAPAASSAWASRAATAPR
jgi:biotin synthase-like enzyme